MGKGKQKAPRFAAAFSEFLPATHADALLNEGTVLMDMGLGDLAALERGTLWEHTVFGDVLPPRYLSKYNVAIAKAFILCLAMVLWKLAQPDVVPLACVGEELAAAALIDAAKVVVEDEEPFDALIDEWFEDTDFLYLFSGAYDGIENTVFGKDVMAIVNLKLEDWFKPFRPDAPVHPCLWDTSPPATGKKARRKKQP